MASARVLSLSRDPEILRPGVYQRHRGTGRSSYSAREIAHARYIARRKLAVGSPMHAQLKRAEQERMRGILFRAAAKWPGLLVRIAENAESLQALRRSFNVSFSHVRNLKEDLERLAKLIGHDDNLLRVARGLERDTRA